MTDPQTDPVNIRISQLIQIMADDVLSASEIMSRMGLSHKKTFRDNYLRPALEKGMIAMTLPDTPNSKYQKYKVVFNR